MLRVGGRRVQEANSSPSLSFIMCASPMSMLVTGGETLVRPFLNFRAPGSKKSQSSRLMKRHKESDQTENTVGTGRTGVMPPMWMKQSLFWLRYNHQYVGWVQAHMRLCFAVRIFSLCCYLDTNDP